MSISYDSLKRQVVVNWRVPEDFGADVYEYLIETKSVDTDDGDWIEATRVAANSRSVVIALADGGYDVRITAIMDEDYDNDGTVVLGTDTVYVQSEAAGDADASAGAVDHNDGSLLYWTIVPSVLLTTFIVFLFYRRKKKQNQSRG